MFLCEIVIGDTTKLDVWSSRVRYQVIAESLKEAIKAAEAQHELSIETHAIISSDGDLLNKNEMLENFNVMEAKIISSNVVLAIPNKKVV